MKVCDWQWIGMYQNLKQLHRNVKMTTNTILRTSFRNCSH